MKYKELLHLKNEELVDHLLDLKKEHFNLRMQNASNRLENKSRTKQVKKDIARIKTLQNINK